MKLYINRNNVNSWLVSTDWSLHWQHFKSNMPGIPYMCAVRVYPLLVRSGTYACCHCVPFGNSLHLPAVIVSHLVRVLHVAAVIVSLLVWVLHLLAVIVSLLEYHISGSLSSVTPRSELVLLDSAYAFNYSLMPLFTTFLLLYVTLGLFQDILYFSWNCKLSSV